MAKETKAIRELVKQFVEDFLVDVNIEKLHNYINGDPIETIPAKSEWKNDNGKI